MTTKKRIRTVCVSTIVIVALVLGVVVGYGIVRERNEDARRAQYKEHFAAGRLVGRTTGEVTELLGEPSMTSAACDGASEYGWRIRTRAADSARDPAGIQSVDEYLTVVWHGTGRSTLAEFREIRHGTDSMSIVTIQNP